MKDNFPQKIPKSPLVKTKKNKQFPLKRKKHFCQKKKKTQLIKKNQIQTHKLFSEVHFPFKRSTHSNLISKTKISKDSIRWNP